MHCLSSCKYNNINERDKDQAKPFWKLEWAKTDSRVYLELWIYKKTNVIRTERVEMLVVLAWGSFLHHLDGINERTWIIIATKNVYTKIKMAKNGSIEKRSICKYNDHQLTSCLIKITMTLHKLLDSSYVYYEFELNKWCFYQVLFWDFKKKVTF